MSPIDRMAAALAAAHYDTTFNRGWMIAQDPGNQINWSALANAAFVQMEYISHDRRNAMLDAEIGL